MPIAPTLRLTGSIRSYLVVSVTTMLGDIPNSTQASAVPTTLLAAPTNLAATAGNKAVGMNRTATRVSPGLRMGELSAA